MPVFGNNYYPATYQPYSQQYAAQYQQPQYQVAQTVQSNPPMQNSIGWVNDERDANLYPIAPNNSVDLHESSGKRIYVKFADATGHPTIRTYELIPPAEPEHTGEPKEMPYAMKDDVAAVVSALKDLSGVVSAIKGELDGIKGDVYGIAGKRKPAKKVEVEDDDE